MAASKLQVWNDALRLCNERRLASLTDDREGKRLLDEAWGDGATNGSVLRCLEAGQWTFASRTVQIDYSPSVTPSFGFRYAFDYPSDFVRLCGIWQDEYMAIPLTAYSAERAYWYCDLQTIYVQYVSNGATFGADLSLWPGNFTKTVAADLANEIVGNLSQAAAVQDKVEKNWRYWMKEAEKVDAMNRPTKRFPIGSWEGARLGGWGRRRDDRWGGWVS